MSIMLSWLNTHRLAIVILLISLALISTVVSEDSHDRQKRWPRRSRQINCAIYVFAPRCRGVAAKRSSSAINPASLPVTRDVPEIYQLFQKSLPKQEEDSLSPLPGLILPRAYSHQILSQPKLQRLQRLQEEQQEEQQQLQEHPMLRSLLQLLYERSEGQPEAEDNRSQWSRNLLGQLRRKRRQAPLSSEVFSST